MIINDLYNNNTPTLTEGMKAQELAMYCEKLVAEKGLDAAYKHAMMMANVGRDPAWNGVLKYLDAMKQGMAEGSLDEVSQDTARSYAQKARVSQKDLINQTHRKGADTDALNKKIQNRQQGMDRAHTDKRYYKDEQGVAEGSEDKIKQLKQDYATAIHWSKNDTNPHKREAARQKAEKIKGHLEKQYKQGVAEASLGDYRKKAALSKATSQIDRFFGRDDPAQADQTIAKRERGLARADARVKPYTAPPVDVEKRQRDLTARYPNIDELVRRAELNRDPDYEMADGQAYYAARDAEQNYQKLKQIQRVIQGLNESLNRSHLP
jgi:hypothetical protein